jgi:hypothetical protein
MKRRGRHQSTCKAGRATLARVAALKDVQGVIIGMSVGGKSIGGAATGAIKVQRALPGGLKCLLQSSKGVQEVYLQVTPGREGMVSEHLRLM